MDTWNVQGKSVLITGASGNLGKVLAGTLSKAGCRLVLQCREEKKSKMLEFQRTLKCESIILVGDLSSPSDITKIFSKIEKQYETLDFLINNAGMQGVVPFDKLDSKEWDTVLNVNIRSPHLCTIAFRLLHLKNPAQLPSIVNIASIEGSIPALSHAHYAASKGGLIQYTMAAALELGGLGIRVNSVSPGLLNTPGIDLNWPDGVARYTKSSPLSRLVDPVEVANTVLFLLSPLASGITGIDLRVDTGMGVVQGY
ncbi:MAG: SDR family NAD(P)-dependent oxidoreductase [Spirochaetia bacterium]|jgi:NAD(P)-dependent dehydrogenase (short-subunit alcohol dehydrogenase family)|nr:SDR family NAD(P)-dependent oxidoreductase [Spirochaetia bacterium]